MSSDKSVTQWIADLKAGDPQAAQFLWERYFEELVRVARQRLGSVPKRIADEEDVAISAFNSLCCGAARGQFSKLTDRNDLWRLLLTITKRKAIGQIRYQGRQKRGGGEVRGESVFAKLGDDQSMFGIAQIVSEDPTPEFLTQLDEQHQRLLDMLRDDTLRNLALWKLEGYTNAEIAAKLGLGERSIERKLQMIREKWSKELQP